MLALICTTFITLKTETGTAPTRVELPAVLIEASDLRFKVDMSEAVKRFPNRDLDVDYTKIFLSRELCKRS